jgi:hypothetical protein
VALEIRTTAGPSSAVQCVLSGGPYTTASQVRQCQLVCPPPPVSEAGDMPDEDLVRAEAVSVRAARRWVGDPLPGRG